MLAGLVFASHAAGTKYSSSAEVAGSDSAAANDVMARSFDANLSDASPIVYHVEDGKLTDDANRAVVEDSMRSLSAAENVKSVSDPYEKLSRDGRTAYSTMLPSTALGDVSVEDAEAILDSAAKPAEGSGVQVEAG